MLKACFECSEPLAGREDKKFCSDGCRNSFNNRINKPQNRLMRKINSQLRRNYRILANVSERFPDGKIPRENLIDQGFDFRFFTGIIETRDGDTYYCLYDRGYKRLKNGRLKILNKELSP